MPRVHLALRAVRVAPIARLLNSRSALSCLPSTQKAIALAFAQRTDPRLQPNSLWLEHPVVDRRNATHAMLKRILALDQLSRTQRCRFVRSRTGNAR